MYKNMYTHTCIHIHVYIYIYIYVGPRAASGGRPGAGPSGRPARAWRIRNVHLYMCMYMIYVYISRYIYIYIYVTIVNYLCEHDVLVPLVDAQEVRTRL